ncbi:conserved hypothetical protein [uncultured Desulfovibrio sp.]|uniref:Sce7725 family protein n=1 Tax=uncultured Desulfovibrio sp. TaxID=167968 RepID=A0A212JSK4_9BACT|nr:sce7725 family protein [Desulfovibrio desulfuricans]MCB6541380.1 sce7725 family protein [Desulfovibrio desulfuricans]MCB6552462.1 sce7725 family protein [Desulfovibrio desulfuricans]MCB6564290.1 sce7725 family protein [Desulfovibrio desulfuricans]MCB7345486.1 sce7725 family protein [Desulfovibrio desulfuricans]MCQ4860888.1 sce7725 family protein [Desulfovibrio desulfuricans]
MYFPYIRGKMYDLAAIAELSEEIAGSGKICPIVEPVNVSAATQNKISLFAETGMPFLLIVNPHVGSLSKNPNEVKQTLFDLYLTECETCFPAFIIDSKTTQGEVSNFFSKYSEQRVGLIYESEPTDQNFVNFLIGHSQVQYHVFFEYKTKRQIRTLLDPSMKVIVGDWFEKQDRNADYPYESSFSDQYLTVPDDEYGNFGDFSVIGRAYSASGGRVHAVALHHIYAKSNSGNALFVRHFVSDRTDSPVDPGGKFIEALTKLVNALPTFGRQNSTPIDVIYQSLHAASRYPGLGVAKKLALKHHMHLMLRLLP